MGIINPPTHASTVLTLPFQTALVAGDFVERPNRFIGMVNYQGSVVRCHVPDPGRLPELMVPGRPVMIADYGPDTTRKTRYAVILVKNPALTHWVCVDTQFPNRLVRHALQQHQLPGFETDTLLKPEFKLGQSRFDFLTQPSQGLQRLIEVKAVSLVDDTTQTGLFPDAPTTRGTKHLLELTHLQQSGTYQCAVLFMVQRSDAQCVKPNTPMDPAFSQALSQAAQAGVSLHALACHFTPQGAELQRLPLPVQWD